MNAHEAGLLAFLAEPTRRRVERLLDLGPKRRADLRAKLYHEMRFDPDFARPVQGADATPERIAALLTAAGAPAACHAISADRKLDGRDLPLAEALGVVVGRGFGTYLSCIPGRLAFFEYEYEGRYLLRRPA